MTNLAVAGVQIAGNALVQAGTAIAAQTASQFISNAFDTRNFQGPQLESFHLQTSRDGAPMPRVFGRVRLAGQVIWASHMRETSSEERVGGGKGGPTQTNYSYSISFAIGLCEGEILGVDRIWANGAPLATDGLTIRTHRGTSDQPPDPVIAATEPGAVPAFRDTAYIVFEDFPLDNYGGRLPQINVEIVRAVGTRSGRLEELVRSVCLLPGSGEFAYSSTIVEERPTPGLTRPVNMNNMSGQADLELALDQLQAQLPNCGNVSIISAWFGSSLACGECEIRPGVERRERVTRGISWHVGRDDRGTAYLISQDAEGRPNFGGTPSDESLISAIRSLRQRGLSVTLYPFLMMDADGFPWRGRVTTQDQSVTTRADVEVFFGTAQVSDYSLGAGSDHYRADDNRYRNFILSHANLARRAGGVDRFIIGSEMKALTTLRDPAGAFPAVEQMADLAADVRAILGQDTGLTYAADWSEYFGYQPQDGSGDVFYHLDPLWASPAITAVGIDAYFPLSDWRDGAHLDADNFETPYELDYLIANIEGGEGYDWYYASDADREAQNRLPISDWVYRYKDLRNWWSQPHFNVVDGVSIATDWQPESKPFWLTEVGCPAVRYGANQPNLFSDGKSIESNIPYYSDGSRDDLMQRRYLESLIGYWAGAQNNPVSIVTGARMIDPDATSVWAWDARPFPDFPARTDVWSDGPNWQTGHWINGRTGLVPLGDVLTELTEEAGLEDIDVSRVTGLVSGYVIDRPMRTRDALIPLLQIYDVVMAETAGQVEFFAPDAKPIFDINPSELIVADMGAITFETEDGSASLRDARVAFIDAGRDYQIGSVSARNDLAATVRVADIRAPLVMDVGHARAVADRVLAQSEPARHTARFAVPPSTARALSAGGRVRLPDTDATWQITSILSGTLSEVSAIQLAETAFAKDVSGPTPVITATPSWVSEPAALVFDLPGRAGPHVGALMSPFRPASLEAGGQSVTTETAVKIGATLSPLTFAPVTVWDHMTTLDIWLPDATLVARPAADILSQGNRFAVETAKGWEIIAAANITLIGPEQWRLRTLLRGLDGSDDAQVESLSSGARIVWLDAGLETLSLDADYIGQPIELSVVAGGRTGIPAQFTYEAAHRRPLSPVHAEVKPTQSGVRLSWIGRSAIDRDDPRTYRVRWLEQVLETSETVVDLPLSLGQQTSVEISEIDPFVGPGPALEIYV